MGGRRSGRTRPGAGRSRPPTAAGAAPKTLPRSTGRTREYLVTNQRVNGSAVDSGPETALVLGREHRCRHGVTSGMKVDHRVAGGGDPGPGDLARHIRVGGAREGRPVAVQPRAEPEFGEGQRALAESQVPQVGKFGA